MALTSGEFSLIHKLVARRPKKETLFRPCLVGAGDDAALLQGLLHPVITTDTQREGVHFKREWQTPFEIGARAAQVTLSDLAASFATPVALFVNLAMPHDMDDAVVQEIYDGLASVLSAHGCDLGGGNTSKASELSLDLFAIGEAMGEMPLRSNAKPGELLCVTGPLGLARAGLHCLQTHDTRFPELVHAFKYPKARCDAAAVLNRCGVHCAMDVSDGLAGDAAHMAKASGVTLDVNLTDLAVPEPLAAWSKATGEDPHFTMACGGEEYQLLFTCSETAHTEIIRELPDLLTLGRIIPFDGDYLKGFPPGSFSFEHL